ncbi:MAG: YigZ family protein [Cyclobacteriaceae bacterium]|nr:YigZ family protein [Cyclobacteriaceae bacterium]
MHLAYFSFRTLEGPSEGLFKDRGSKFLAFAYPVRNEEDIKDRLSALKKKYFDARHHCYAWMLGADRDRYRAFDDGEPNHSAGDPILGQIRSQGLTNVLIVVLRYFGGVKLGVSGLIQAYRAAAADALTKATLKEVEVSTVCEIRFDYAAMPEVMRLLKLYGISVLEQNYDSDYRLLVAVPLRLMDKLQEQLKRLRVVKISVTVNEQGSS